MAENYDFLQQPAELVAPRLLGCELVRYFANSTVRCMIVETEAYDQSDAASHSYKGRTPRTDVMFGPAGHLYVYFTYGMHYCCNIVTGLTGDGSAVLIRAVEPTEGRETMASNRSHRKGIVLSNGPAKLCQALAIDKSLNGHNLHAEPLKLMIKPALPSADIVTTSRVGISQAKDMPWRFYIRNNPYVSATKTTGEG